MTAPATTSQQLYTRALAFTPTGAHSNSRIRRPHPLYVTRADGAWLYDADGRRWLDFTMGNGSIILGHNNPAVQQAVHEAVHRGVTTGYETPDAVDVVDLLAELIPDFRALRLANTGTEAVLHALAIARAATGRTRIAKPEASYHGWADPVWVSTWPPLADAGPADRPAAVPGSAGLSRSSADTLVLPFNDIEATSALLHEHGPELAALILEPAMIDIGYVAASAEYIHGLYELTRRYGIVLIFDELLTGFRLAPGGAREVYGLTPDLATYGKAIANGYPLAAVEGRRDLLDLTDPGTGGPVGWVGTYNAHAVTVAAARASLDQLRSGAVWQKLQALTKKLSTEFEELAAARGVDAALPGAGGHFQPYFRSGPPDDYRAAATTSADRYAALYQACQQDDVLIADKPLGHCALSAAHTDADIETLLHAAARSFSTPPENSA
jgi:glutamate-1-semialdehyde 2,1-aminomutase